MPVLPGLTDGEEGSGHPGASGARRRVRIGSRRACYFLMPSSRKQFFPFLAAKFPRLARQYHQWYDREGYAPEAYRAQITERIEKLRQKYGLRARPAIVSRAVQAEARQMTLSLG